MKKTPKKSVALLSMMILTIIIGAFFWSYYEEVSILKHETQRWAVLEDENGNRISIETESSIIWDELTILYQNERERFIGDSFEEYDNKWGFRYDPENIIIRELVAEENQTTIYYLYENTTYRKSLDGAYIRARIVQIYGESRVKSNDVMNMLFEANLNFSALLLAVIGIIISIYIKAEHPKWMLTFKVLLLLFFSIFLMSITSCLISFFYIIEGVNLAPLLLSNVVVTLFYLELILSSLAGLIFLKLII